MTQTQTDWPRTDSWTSQWGPAPGQAQTQASDPDDPVTDWQAHYWYCEEIDPLSNDPMTVEPVIVLLLLVVMTQLLGQLVIETVISWPRYYCGPNDNVTQTQLKVVWRTDNDPVSQWPRGHWPRQWYWRQPSDPIDYWQLVIQPKQLLLLLLANWPRRTTDSSGQLDWWQLLDSIDGRWPSDWRIIGQLLYY